MMEKQKHMTYEIRKMIEDELKKGSSFLSIARLTGKSSTTISREVRERRISGKTGSCGRRFNDCIHSFNHTCSVRNVCSPCTNRSRPCRSCGLCIDICAKYEKYTCPRLASPPYVCSACESRNTCSLEKYFYEADSAQQAYLLSCPKGRPDFRISENDLKKLDDLVSPLLRKGQSIPHIYMNHASEIGVSERTLYYYVEKGLFSALKPASAGAQSAKKAYSDMRADKVFRIGRSYRDFEEYTEKTSAREVRQCDSVEGVKGGSVLLTIHFVRQELQLAFIRDSNDAQSVIDIFERLYHILRPDTYRKLFPILLCDNGSEFSNPLALEFDRAGRQRSRVFYCNPCAPYQKGNCENNHTLIRRIIPKGQDMSGYSQEEISLMMSHINSYSRKNLGNRSPYDIFAEQYGAEVLKKLGIMRIPADEVCLKPSLLRKREAVPRPLPLASHTPPLTSRAA